MTTHVSVQCRSLFDEKCGGMGCQGAWYQRGNPDQYHSYHTLCFFYLGYGAQLPLTGVVAARIICDMKFNFKLNNYARDDPGFAKLPSVMLDRLHIPRRSSTLPVFQEASAFRNGKECIVSAPSSWRSGYSQLQEEEDDDTELCDSTAVHIHSLLK